VYNIEEFTSIYVIGETCGGKGQVEIRTTKIYVGGFFPNLFWIIGKRLGDIKIILIVL